MERRIARRSLEDGGFRQQLLDNPEAALEEIGARPPKDTVRALEETADTVYLVLPGRSAGAQAGDELSNRDLETVAGGDNTFMCTYTCPPPQGATCATCGGCPG